VHGHLADVSQERQNFHWLNDSAATVGGQRFVGGTLWFQDTADSVLYRHMLSDFAVIDGFLDWVFEANAATMRFLADVVSPSDIVVTHHLPCQLSVHDRYRGDKLNPFFVCDMTAMIEQCEPKLWIHGHTHSSCDYEVFNTRVVCNPMGYAGHELNPEYADDVVVEL
jgi:Icc-related predicted phosphoesterase